MKRFIFIICMAILTLSGCQKQAVKQNRLNLTFSSLEEGQNIISTSDKFTGNMHSFDFISRLSEAGLEGTEENYLKVCRNSVREWNEKEKALLSASAARLQAKIDSCAYLLPIPENINLIKTTMVEEGGAAGYTRGTNIFIEDCSDIRPDQEISVDYLLAHELFHILSRHDADFRKAMYQQIGFEVLSEEIEFPENLLEMRISNPDVNSYDSYSSFTIDGQKSVYTMWFYNNHKEYTGGPFFMYGEPGLIPLDAQYKPVMADNGNPIIYPLDQAEDFFSRIGENTGYVINPEEALAENFAFALMDYFPYGEKSPEVISRLREVMKGSWKK